MNKFWICPHISLLKEFKIGRIADDKVDKLNFFSEILAKICLDYNSIMFCIERMNFCSLKNCTVEFDSTKISAWPDQNVAMILGWCRLWQGCWCSCSLRAGLGPGAGLRFCLWLSFTQIAESCLWEPKIWSPGIPGGIFGRTAQLSSLFCEWGGF